MTWLLMLLLVARVLSQHCINSYCSTISDCGSGCNSCAPDGVCSGSRHDHYPHSHDPHSHRPHGHNPHSHHPHSHQPGPGPTPSACKWPVFASRAELQADAWGQYYKAVYGALPTAGDFPLDVSTNWLLHDGAIIKAGLQTLCKSSECPLNEKDRYSTNDMYQPPLVSWIWHTYPYPAQPASTWVEVLHEADPFGDEHHGMWLVFTPGSGIWFNLGVTIAFPEHQDAYNRFGIGDGDNEKLSLAAAAAGFDSIQFLAHVDHVNYQCDTHNTGRPGFDYSEMAN
jgi:hypothetical protein